MRVLDLFSGIGGFSLGLERAGMTTVAFCEIEPFCRRVLAKHWPGVPIYDDVRQLTAARLAADGIGVDVICGGFPCQDISIAGKGAGLAGERSGLWREYARIIRELRPRYVVVENVAALLGRGLGDVLGDLAEIGYDAEWHCIPASAVGAPHRRDRVWIIANADGRCVRGSGAFARDGRQVSTQGQQRVFRGGNGGEDVADADSEPVRHDGHRRSAGSPGKGQSSEEERQRVRVDVIAGGGGVDVADADSAGLEVSRPQPDGADRIIGRGMLAADSWWAAEPDVGRVANGVPGRVDRLRALGNAVVPQIPELIGRAIMEAA